ncbi:MAG: phospholipase D-like domain-containing protein [Candidatus Omnitrophota bacterium]
MKKFKKFIVISIVSISVAICSGKTYAYQADVQNLSGDKYFETTVNAINGAEESIFVVMYYVNWNPFEKKSKSNAIIQALVDAHRRGVAVKVILDQTMDLTSEQDEELSDWELFKAKNIYVYELFQREGIDVSFDQPSVNTHSKVLIIDKKLVILGSSNWTETALNKNVESNLLVESRKLAESLEADFRNVEVQKPVVISSESNIKIPFKFLENPRLLSEMATQNDEQALDVYLTLLRYSDPKTNTVTISYDKIIEDLKLTQKQARTQINRTFRKLRDKYELMGFKDEDIFRKDIVVLKILPQQDEREIGLPIGYFTYDWDKKLSLRAKVLYLVSLACYITSDSKPWFFAPREEIEKQFHLKKWYISNGMQELRELNIIDIRYSKFDEDSKEVRIANHYKVLGLYNPEKVDEKFAKLSERFGEANVQKARDYAKVVYKENDPEAIETLLKLTTDYGEEAVKKAVRVVAKKRTDNPKRSFAYLRGIIETP